MSSTITRTHQDYKTNYSPDYFYLSLGAGVQSTTIVEMIVEGELPAPNLILFADTGDEPSYVYENVSYLRMRLKEIAPLLIVRTGDILQDLYSNSRFAAMPLFTNQSGNVGRLKRQCTREYKIEPIQKAVKRDLLSKGLAKQDKRGISVQKGLVIHNWLGISLDEVQRMKPDREWWVDAVWPLIDLRMTRLDCINWLKKHDLPIPGKSSCRICPFHNNNHYRHVKDHRPDDWQHVIKFDSDLRDPKSPLRIAATAHGELFQHKTLLPMDQVDLRTRQEKGEPSLFDFEHNDLCDGYCNT